MKSGFWVVLSLVGAVPVGALAQQAQQPPAGQARVPQEVSNEMLQQQVNELWQGFRMLQQEVAALREEMQRQQAAPAVAGTGQPGEAAPAEEAAAEQTPTIIVELPEPQEGAPQEGVGGAGPGAEAQEEVMAGDIYLGTVRGVMEDRLFLRERTGRVYELAVSEETEVIDWDGSPRRLGAIEEGTPVRAVAAEGAERDEVHTLYILEPPPLLRRR